MESAHRRVVVVGAGPVGRETSRVLAGAGHAVTVVTRSGETGVIGRRRAGRAWVEGSDTSKAPDRRVRGLRRRCLNECPEGDLNPHAR